MLRWIQYFAIVVSISAALFAPAMAADEKKSDVDRAFLDLTAMHHHDGIEMARLAEKKATRDDEKAFAQKTRTGQEKDLREITAAREKLFKGQPEAERRRRASR